MAREIINKIITDLRLIKGKYYFDNFYSDSLNKHWFHKYNLSRKIMVSNRGKANPYNLTASFSRVKIIRDSTCPYGSDVQDLDYLLFQYPLHDKERIEYQ